MVNATFSLEQMRNELARALEQYNISVEEFLSSDLEKYSDANLRDMWLMVKGVFPAKD